MTHDRDRARRADRWRAGWLEPEQARRFEQDMDRDAALAVHAQFGARIAQALVELPRLAAQRQVRRGARRPRWARLAAAGALGMSLVVLGSVGFSSWSVLPFGSAQQVNAQTADAVQNMDFYDWLAEHPQLIDTAGQRDAS